MFEIRGKYNTIRVHTDIVDEETVGQIQQMANQKFIEGSQVEIMPDCHYGKGAVVGMTMTIKDKVVPSFVGVDIGCGMRVVQLGKIHIDFPLLDAFIHEHIPYGSKVHSSIQMTFPLESLYCFPQLSNIGNLKKSLGSLGGGNHFIEIDQDEEQNLYLVIHTGSRSLGKEVGELYTRKAVAYHIALENHQINAFMQAQKKNGRKCVEMEERLLKEATTLSIPKAYSYLEGSLLDAYLHDMEICQEFARLNRAWIAEQIISFLGLSIRNLPNFECVHNYISLKDHILRKGAISSYEGEFVLIPINMKDGCILGKGKSNPSYNYSAPHGAGRLLSRKQARETISLEEYQEVMKGIYSTSISHQTIDESPMAYKPIEAIIENIQDTVEIIQILKPIYNFKAS